METRFYGIGEVSRKTGVAPHVLRYWEREFPFFRPTRDTRGRRLYTERDFEKIRKIQALLYDEGYRIRGVKKKFREVYNMSAGGRRSTASALRKILKMIQETEKCLQ